MTAADFIAWQRRLGLTGREAAALLGVSEFTVLRWRKGKTAPPPFLALACLALENGLGLPEM